MAVGCKGLLKDFAIADVEVAFWESLFTRSSGPQLYNHVPSDHATATVCSPLTPALGLQIAARATPHREGTGGVFICEGCESKTVFLLTARHVVIPPDAEHNQLYAHTKSSEPRQDVLLLGRKAFKDALKSIFLTSFWNSCRILTSSSAFCNKSSTFFRSLVLFS